MEPIDAVCKLRTRLDDTVKDYLWSTEELEGYLDEGYRAFAKDTQLLIDMSTASVCTYAVTGSPSSVTLSPFIVDIRRAFDADNNLEFEKKNSDKLPIINVPTSKVMYVCADREKDKLYFYPKSSQDFTLTLQVARYPLETFSISGMSNPLEFQDEEAWNIIVHYAASRAYLKDDVETLDLQKSGASKSLYNLEVDDYRVDVERKNREPGVIDYGGL